MHRIDTPGSINDKFSDGNPQTGQRATVVSAAWLNDLQENLMTVLEQAEIEPEKGTPNQLYLALVALISSALEGVAAGGGGGAGYVPTNRQISTAGLASGGGTLANNLNLNVPAASVAEVLAGTVNNKAVTPANLLGAITALRAATGYFRFHGGLIMQWGTWHLARWSTGAINLPIAFPLNCVWAGVHAPVDDNDTVGLLPTVLGRGTSLLSIRNARSEALDLNYLTVGY